MGHYALGITFSDRHRTGIFSWTPAQSRTASREDGPGGLQIELQVVIAGSGVKFPWSRGTVNKTETAVELRLDVGPSGSLSNNDKERIVEALAPRLAGEDST